MPPLHWTKFQDFYLRLGFLKVLVAALNPQRPSVTNESIYRRLKKPLLESAEKFPALREVAAQIDWYAKAHKAGTKLELPAVAEALLVSADSDSLLFAITESTAYKILDWGHDIGLVGRGNQLTERGAILRSLLTENRYERFFDGDPTAWNPFVLSPEERLFFLFHLTELDGVTEELTMDVAKDGDKTIDTAIASRLTCHALFRVLDREKNDVQSRDAAAYRTARSLACTIARELDLTQYETDCVSDLTRRVPKPKKISRGRVIGSDDAERKTTKNADHQTIPRFEQLVDLGFLTKPHMSGGNGSPRLDDKRHWRYRSTPLADRWAQYRRNLPSMAHQKFAWNHFANAASRNSELIGRVPSASQYSLDDALQVFASAYEQIGRPMGHTPLDSVALLAMIKAVCAGKAIEMSSFHRIMLMVKQRDLLPEQAFFASGNDLDKMFILLRRGALGELSRLRNELAGWEGEING